MAITLHLKRVAVGTFVLISLLEQGAVGEESTRDAPLRLPNFKVGDPIRFSYARNYWNEPSRSDGAMSETFDLQVLKVRPDGALVRWTLRSEATSGFFGHVGLVDYIMDIPFDVDVDSAGRVQGIANFDSVKEALLRSTHDNPAWAEFWTEDAKSQQASIRDWYSEIAQIMASMQSRDPIAFGHNVLAPEVRNDPIPGLQYTAARTMDLRDVDRNHCRARFVRHTVQTCRYNGEPCEQPTYLDASATVSTDDGLIIEFHSFMRFPLDGAAKGSGRIFGETIDLHRLTPVATRCEQG